MFCLSSPLPIFSDCCNISWRQKKHDRLDFHTLIDWFGDEPGWAKKKRSDLLLDQHGWAGVKWAGAWEKRLKIICHCLYRARKIGRHPAIFFFLRQKISFGEWKISFSGQFGDWKLLFSGQIGDETFFSKRTNCWWGPNMIARCVGALFVEWCKALGRSDPFDRVCELIYQQAPSHVPAARSCM